MARSSASNFGTKAVRGGRRVTTVAGRQWQHVRNRSTRSGTIIFYFAAIVVVVCYSAALVILARRSSPSSSAASARRRGHGPNNLLRDDADDGNEKGDDHAALTPEKKACSWSTHPVRHHLDGELPASLESDKMENISRRAKDRGPELKDGCYTDISGRAISCVFSKLILDTSKIHLIASGGEELASVMGQAEEKEFVSSYDNGAFSVPSDTKIPSLPDLTYGQDWYGNEEMLYYLRPVISSMIVRNEANDVSHENNLCTSGTIVETPTLFLTRYDYVNLKSMLSDLFDVYGANYAFSKENNAFDLIFLDGHPQGGLDQIWHKVVDGTVNYVKQLEHAKVCYTRAILVPPSFMSPILSPHCSPDPSMMERFVSHVLLRYDKQLLNRVKKNIVIIDRVGYVSHPRINTKAMMRRISNLPELKAAIESGVPGAQVHIIRPETLSFDDQLEIIRKAEVLIGKFGSGMSNLLFMDDDTLSIELDSESYGLYSGFSMWKGDMKHAHVQVESNLGVDDPVGELNTPTIANIVQHVKDKVNCNLWDGNYASGEFNTVICKKLKGISKKLPASN